MSPEQLDASGQAAFQQCDASAQKLAESTAKTRTKNAKALLADARLFSASYPDVFRGWAWQAQAALILSDKEAGKTAFTNMIQLGGTKSSNPQIMALMSAIEAKGWMDADADSQAVVSSQAAWFQYAGKGSVADWTYVAYMNKVGDNRFEGYYFYDRDPSVRYTLKGAIEYAHGLFSRTTFKLEEYTDAELSANIALYPETKAGSITGHWKGQMNNTTGSRRKYDMTLVVSEVK